MNGQVHIQDRADQRLSRGSCLNVNMPLVVPLMLNEGCVCVRGGGGPDF